MKRFLIFAFTFHFYHCLISAEEIKELNSEKRTELVGGAIIINKPVDIALEQISNGLVDNNLDPAQLPDIEDDFKVKGLILTHHGKLRLTHGWLQDLKTIQRDGNALLTMKLTKWNFKIPIALFKIEFGYDYYVKLGLMKRSGGIMGDVTDFQMCIYATFNVINKKVTDLQTDVTDIGTINTQLTGRPWTDWWINAFISSATDLIHDEIVSFINTTANLIAQQVIDAINNHLPLYSINVENSTNFNTKL